MAEARAAWASAADGNAYQAVRMQRHGAARAPGLPEGLNGGADSNGSSISPARLAYLRQHHRPASTLALGITVNVMVATTKRSGLGPSVRRYRHQCAFRALGAGSTCGIHQELLAAPASPQPELARATTGSADQAGYLTQCLACAGPVGAADFDLHQQPLGDQNRAAFREGASDRSPHHWWLTAKHRAMPQLDADELVRSSPLDLAS